MKNTTPLLLETIRIEKGRAINLPYHQRRFDRSRKAHFHHLSPLSLAELISPPDTTHLWRCRISYHKEITAIEYLPYTPKVFRHLKVVSSSLSYPYKYYKREALKRLQADYSDYDDIIIEKEGLLTDTTIANIAFYDGKRWLTPKTPLLEGTMRAKLIDEGFLHPHPIRKEDISSYTYTALMNAMIGFKILSGVKINTSE